MIERKCIIYEPESKAEQRQLAQCVKEKLYEHKLIYYKIAKER